MELAGVEKCPLALIVPFGLRTRAGEIPVSGASGSRTRVQTRNTYAFYTLILAFIFVRQQDPNHQLPAYLLNFRHPVAAHDTYSVNSCAAIPFQPTDSAWSDVSFGRLAPKYANLLYFD